MRGEKYGDDIKEKAFALLSTNNNISAVARELNVPRTTLIKWKSDFENPKKPKKKKGKNPEKDLVKARQQKKEQFIADAWSGIEHGMSLLQRRLERADEKEDLIDKFIDIVERNGDLTAEESKKIAVLAKNLKIEDLGRIAVTVGTLYDKMALASGDSTANVDAKIVPKKFEDL